MILELKDYNSYFEEQLILANKIKDEIDGIFAKIDDNNLDYYDYEETISKLEEDIIPNKISMYLISDMLDMYVVREPDEKYDVTKIKISNEFYEYMKEYDKKLLKIATDFSSVQIDKELAMMYLFSGFATDDGLQNGNILLETDFLIKQR